MSSKAAEEEKMVKDMKETVEAKGKVEHKTFEERKQKAAKEKKNMTAVGETRQVKNVVSAKANAISSPSSLPFTHTSFIKLVFQNGGGHSSSIH